MYTKIMFAHHLSITRFVVEFLEFHDAIAWLLNHLNHVPKYRKQDIYITTTTTTKPLSPKQVEVG